MATSPNAKTGAAVISRARLPPQRLNPYAMPISDAMLNPSQYALKLPATNPARMLSDAPPSFDALTTSFTWPDSTDVKTFTNSGMIAPASVPQVITDDSFHHSVPSPRPGISMYETAY